MPFLVPSFTIIDDVSDKTPGRYSNSKYKNISVGSFAKSKREGIHNKHCLGTPGFKYKRFSEFGTQWYTFSTCPYSIDLWYWLTGKCYDFNSQVNIIFACSYPLAQSQLTSSPNYLGPSAWKSLLVWVTGSLLNNQGRLNDCLRPMLSGRSYPRLSKWSRSISIRSTNILKVHTVSMWELAAT